MILTGEIEVYRGRPTGVVTRNGDNGAPQTLVLTDRGCFLALKGASGQAGLELDAPLIIKEQVLPWRVLAYQPHGDHSSPVWDPYSQSVFLCRDHGILRLVGNTLFPVAGDSLMEGVDLDRPVPGWGTEARLIGPRHLVSDGKGNLFCATGDDGNRITWIRLPPCLRASEQTDTASSSRPTHISAGPGAAVSAGTVEQVEVGTGAREDSEEEGFEPERVTLPWIMRLPFQAAGAIQGLSYDGSKGQSSLVIATSTALYRLPLPPALGEGNWEEDWEDEWVRAAGLGDDGPGAGAGAGAGAEAARRRGRGMVWAAELLAGRQGEEGDVDGRGPEARFTRLTGCVVDGDGTVWAADYPDLEPEDDDEQVVSTNVLRRVDPDGTVSSTGLKRSGRWSAAAILPNGHLACFGLGGDSECGELLVAGLGLTFPGLGSQAPGTSPAARAVLHEDLGALLDRQPDGTADLTLLVGGRRFAVHRAILAARSAYFRNRLGPGFADGSAAELELPHADPDAFALMLRWLYTGAVQIPAAQAPALAELADRLVLRDVYDDAVAAILASLSVHTVVPYMLWAEQLGGWVAEVQGVLRRWYVERHEQVAAEAPEAVERLALSPKLMAAVMGDLAARSPKRRRRA
ncbi:hypothetical protein HYH03_018043 [Edaphochlamys debaryana]|uniref:BTB domain-containing protein n=1 Tax=Edaphochlamys debaryana TaxID=47281 RepID=A0A835XGS2_9CHLO|nr:hypothetical protein HYH03_018043 [Edaphochlamys debaryana]|eukprot:KAG2483060.1 hypothetical protein HYH03_018043 [Edaphochlamys debaryana]